MYTVRIESCRNPKTTRTVHETYTKEPRGAGGGGTTRWVPGIVWVHTDTDNAKLSRRFTNMITGSGPHVQTTDCLPFGFSKPEGVGGQLHRPHLGYCPRLALLPSPFGFFERLCVEWCIVRTGQRLCLCHKAVLARVAVEWCQVLPMRREQWEKWFRIEREEIGDDTFGGSVLKRQLQS